MSVFHVFYSHLLEAEKIESLEIEMVAHPSIDLIIACLYGVGFGAS